MVPESAPGGSVPAGRAAACFERGSWDIDSQPPDVRCWRCKPTPRPPGRPLVVFCNSTCRRRTARLMQCSSRDCGNLLGSFRAAPRPAFAIRSWESGYHGSPWASCPRPLESAKIAIIKIPPFPDWQDPGLWEIIHNGPRAATRRLL